MAAWGQDLPTHRGKPSIFDSFPSGSFVLSILSYLDFDK